MLNASLVPWGLIGSHLVLAQEPEVIGVMVGVSEELWVGFERSLGGIEEPEEHWAVTEEPERCGPL